MRTKLTKIIKNFSVLWSSSFLIESKERRVSMEITFFPFHNMKAHYIFYRVVNGWKSGKLKLFCVLKCFSFALHLIAWHNRKVATRRDNPLDTISRFSCEKTFLLLPFVFIISTSVFRELFCCLRWKSFWWLWMHNKFSYDTTSHRGRESIFIMLFFCVGYCF